MTIFSYHNSKVNNLGVLLGVKVAAFDTSVGYTCLYAGVCRCYVDQDNQGRRRLTKLGAVRCFAATAELLFPDVYNKRKINSILARSKQFTDIAQAELRQQKIKIMRVHSAGDYFSLQEYIDWRFLAINNPDVMFFGYTKNYHAANHLWKNPLDNYKLCYSWGGTHDKEIYTGVPVCYIRKEGLYTPDNVPVIELMTGDDYKYITSGVSFAIPYH